MHSTGRSDRPQDPPAQIGRFPASPELDIDGLRARTAAGRHLLGKLTFYL